jgi:hypothetical protein
MCRRVICAFDEGIVVVDPRQTWRDLLIHGASSKAAAVPDFVKDSHKSRSTASPSDNDKMVPEPRLRPTATTASSAFVITTRASDAKEKEKADMSCYVCRSCTISIDESG